MYEISFLGQGLYLKFISSDDKIFYFDSSLLILKTDYFKTFFKSTLSPDKTVHKSQYNSSAITYLHNYIYEVNIKRDNNEIPLIFNVEDISQYFNMMGEYCIIDEKFGLELINMLNWKLYRIENPKILLEEISKISIPEKWDTYKYYLNRFRDAFDL